MSAQDDLIVWSDGTTCFGDELSTMTHMSDDYEVVPAGSSRYIKLVQEMH